jgi:hypothetical protein
MKRLLLHAPLVLGFVAVLIAFSGCDRESEEQRIELPETPIVSVRDRWAVVAGAYVRVRAEPADGAAVADYVRRGLIVEVAEVVDQGGAEAETWMRITGDQVDGWVTGSDLSLYESRARARNAAQQFVDSDGAAE